MSALDLGAILAQQQVLVGMAGAALVGGVMFGLRQVPSRIALAARELLSVTLEIDNDEDPFKHINTWLSRQEAAKRVRRARIAETYDYDRGEWQSEITLGAGWHLMFVRGRPLLIHREVQALDSTAAALGPKRERMTLLTLGRSQAMLREMLAEARLVHYGDGRINVYIWCEGQFLLADKLYPRSLGTVFLPPDQKAALQADLARFLEAKATYRERGTPWRRGYLLAGPPGTGKTTLIHVLAGLAQRSIYVINLNSITSDGELMRATNAVGPDGMLVFEDIDSAQITHDREVEAARIKAAPQQTLLGGPGQAARTGPSLSGLLNAIDGVGAREGRIVCITSNHAEKLDPALVRPGRIDLRLEIAPLAMPEAWAMFEAFRPEGDRVEFLRMIGGAHRLPMPASTLQNLLQLAEEQRVTEVAA